MHNIWTISLEGNIATRRQVQALAEALQQELGGAGVTSFFPEPQPTGLSLSIPSLPELQKLGFHAPWPDLVIGCRCETVPIALGIKSASGGKTKLLQIQNPNGPDSSLFTANAFDVVLRQPHENITGDNVVASALALHGLTSDILDGFRKASHEVSLTLKDPIMAVLIGGSDEHVTLTNIQFEKLGDDLRSLAQMHRGTMLVLTSRRTGSANALILETAIKDCGNVRFNDPRLPYTSALAIAKRFVVTAESLSMVSEVLATGYPCSLYDFDGALRQHPLNSVFAELVSKKLVAHFPKMPSTSQLLLFDELPVLAKVIRQKLWPKNQMP